MSWVRRAVTTLVGLVLLALAILYGGSGALMSRDVAADLPRIKAGSDPASIMEGERLAGLAGCTRCHGAQGQGRIISDVPRIGQIVAPSLPQVAAQATDGQIARAIRNGVGIDARPLFVMPSGALNHLSDEDVSRLMGWVRTLPTSAFDVVGSTAVGLRGRFAILTGSLPDSVSLAGGQSRPRPADAGRYLAQVSCGQCHALDRDRRSTVDGKMAPALAQAVSRYDPFALRTLLRTGKGTGNRVLPAMSDTARTGLAALTDGEIEAIRTHLLSLKASRAK